jgi:hypothetical protein
MSAQEVDAAQDMDALIVRHLTDIESASKRIKDDIENNVWKALDDIVEPWLGEVQFLTYKAYYGSNEYSIYAPNNWRIPDSDDKDKFFGSFWIDAFDYAKNEIGWNNEFWLPQLCGLGVGPTGICWGADYSNFNMTKSGWKTFLVPHVSRIREHGFNYVQKEGTFFLPFTVDSEALAVAIEGNNIEDALLGPLSKALQVIKKAKPDFDSLIEDAKKHFKPQEKLSF